MKFRPSMESTSDSVESCESLDICDDPLKDNVEIVNDEVVDGEVEVKVADLDVEDEENETENKTGSENEGSTMAVNSEPSLNNKIDAVHEGSGSENAAPEKSDSSSDLKSAQSNDVKSSGKTVKMSNSTSLNDGLILVASTDHPLANLDNCLENLEEMDRKIMIKKSRRVHFHDHENHGVVKSFHDPPNPWSNPPSFTPEQLVDSYRRACSHNACRPIHKLIGQLEATRDLGERYDTLTLKGERLDKRHCDAVEEILKRVQFKTMDLEATDLDDDSAGAVFDMIEFYESCTRLVLAYNKSIGPRGWQACSRMMKRTPSLKQLDLRSCTISEHSMPFIGRALRVGSLLQVLHVENSGISNKVLLILVAALKLNEHLKELYLADNRLMPSDGIQLGNLLKHNDRLQLLDLRNNHLQDTGLSHVADGLESQDQKGWGLTTLVLWNNQLTQHSMVKLAQALAVNKTLETLNLGHNNLGNEGILTLKEGLLSNRVLKRLGLQASRLSCEAAIALAELIADSKCLVRIDLRENDIKTAGLMALSLSLKMNQSVTRLDLDKEPKKERGVKDFMEQQASLLSDISNWLQRNRELAYCLEQELQKSAEEAKRVEEEIKEAWAETESLVKSESERGETEVHKPVEQLRFDLSRSQSLDSPAQPPDVLINDVIVTHDVTDDDVTSPQPPSEAGGDHSDHTRKRHGNRLFSVKYVPESTLLDSGVSIIPVSPSDTVLSPMLEFPLSLDPAQEPVLPVLVPVDAKADPIMPILVPVDGRNESETKNENESDNPESASEKYIDNEGESKFVEELSEDCIQVDIQSCETENIVLDTSQNNASDDSDDIVIENTDGKCDS